MSSNASASRPLEGVVLSLVGGLFSLASPFVACSEDISVFVSGAGKGSVGFCKTGEERSTRSSDFLSLL